jgi:hypothetical protein
MKFVIEMKHLIAKTLYAYAFSACRSICTGKFQYPV